MIVSFFSILIGMNGIAKISDFGIAHMFAEERKSWAMQMNINEFLFDDMSDKYCQDDNNKKEIDAVESPTHLSKLESEEAINMSSKHSSGMLRKTEGTLCFYSPEMCALEETAFSGYAADLWAAGICLHTFVTGKLPFFSLNPADLFDMIVKNEVQYDNLDLSEKLMSLLRKLLMKDPSQRAGVGDCLKHDFCKDARTQRIRTLGKEFEQSTGDIVLTHADINLALSITLKKEPCQSVRESRTPDTKRTHSKINRSIDLNESSSKCERAVSKLPRKRNQVLKKLFKSGYFWKKKKE